MLALRMRPPAAFSGPFWLSALCVAFMPSSIGYQDLASLFARQSAAYRNWHGHLIASPFGTIHAATFRFSRPIGTAMPEQLAAAQLVNFDPRSLDVKVWSVDEPPMAHSTLHIEFPTVNRRLNGDRLSLIHI